MKRLILTAGALAVFAFPAMAADLPARAPVYKGPPPVVAYFSWTGCYVGANGGWYGSHQDATTNPFPSPGFGAPAVGGAGLAGFGLLSTSHDLNQSGGIFGVHGGCNYQAGQFVFGIEGDYEWLHRNTGSDQIALATFPAAPLPAWNMHVNASNSWLASLRGRIGFAADRALFYVTGGAAWTNTSYDVTATGLASGGGAINVVGVNAAGSFGENKTGWVLGAGVEYAAWQNWVVRAEYLHYQFGGASGALPLVSAVPGATCAPGLCNWAVSSSNLKIDTVRVGLSYKFGGPVVANY